MSNPLLFNIHLVDGTVARFIQEGEKESAQILRGVTPARIFREPTLLIGGSSSATAYPTSAITHVVFIYDQLPNWADLNDESVISEVAREQFLKAARTNSSRENRPETPSPEAPEDQTTYARIGLVGGGKIYTEIRTHISARLEQRQLVTRIFQSPFHHIRREGGAILLNTANLLSVSFYPGPPVLPATAWSAHHYVEPAERVDPSEEVSP